MASALYSIIIYPITFIIDFVFFLSLKIFKDPGYCILIISIVISLFCLPLYLSAEGIQKKERDIQDKLKDKIKIIKKVFKGDEQYMILSTYYRQNHYHPMYALRSSLSLAVQIPFFIAAYSYISHLDLIKGASFLFLKDLGSPDKLFFSINILPILMTLINLFSGYFYSKGLATKDKIQILVIALIFLFFLYNSPSGLVVYWTLNNIFSLLKNIYIKSNIKFKKIILFGLFSLLCISMILFIYHNNIGSIKIRHLLVLAFIFLACIPWLIIVLKKYVSKFFSKNIIQLKNDRALFVLSIISIFMIIGVLIPSALISASPQEFSYIDSYSSPFPFLLTTLFQSFGLFLLWPLFFFYLSNKNIKLLFSFFAFCFVGIFVFNYFIFPGNYGFISINMVYSNQVVHAIKEIFINLLIIFAAFILVFLIFIFNKRKYLIPVLIVIISATIVISVHNYYLIGNSYNKMKNLISANNTKTESAPASSMEDVKPIIKLSKKGKNVIVMMLDRAENSFVPYIFQEKSELLKSYTGFVYYPNTVSFGDNTRPGAPALFGGYEYNPFEMNKRSDLSINEKHNEALLLMPILFSREGYSVTVADQPFANDQQFFDTSIYSPYPEITAVKTEGTYNDLWFQEHNLSLPKISDRLNRNLLWYSIFRCSPLFLRPYLYYNGDWCSFDSLDDLLTMLDWYTVLDLLPQLTSVKPGNENNCIVLVNNTTHESAFLQAPDYVPAEKVRITGTSPYKDEPAYHVNAAALARLGEFFDFLRKENVYDNTRIILVADHGDRRNIVGKKYIDLPINLDGVHPLLMVKDFNASGDMKTDNSFMTNGDVPSLAFKDIIANPVNPFTGKPINSEAKKSPLYIAFSLSAILTNTNQPFFPLNPHKDYYVKDNIFVASNWVRVDQEK